MADEVNENIFLVNAPAGSGKTTWIRQQVESYLLRNPKDNILCITYTNRAAEELGRDLEQSRVYFGTIHSFINDFIGSFFSHKEIIDLYWEVYETQIIERIKNTEQKETWTEGAERYKETDRLILQVFHSHYGQYQQPIPLSTHSIHMIIFHSSPQQISNHFLLNISILNISPYLQ